MAIGAQYCTGCNNLPGPAENLKSRPADERVEAPNEGQPGFLDTLVATFGTMDVLLALYHDTSFTSFRPSLISRNGLSDIVLDNILSQKRDSVVSRLSEILVTPTAGPKRQLLVEAVSRWCRAKRIVDDLPELCSCREDAFFEEAVYTNTESKDLFKKYLKAEGQYWGSISIDESLDLYYRVINLIAHSNTSIRASFLEQYSNYFCRRTSVKK